MPTQEADTMDRDIETALDTLYEERPGMPNQIRDVDLGPWLLLAAVLLILIGTWQDTDRDIDREKETTMSDIAQTGIQDTQPKAGGLTTGVAQGAAISAAGSPVDFLAPIMNQKGEIDLSEVDYGQRIAAYVNFAEKANSNLLNFGESILSQIPPGTKLIPIPVIPTLDDCWHGEAASKMKLQPGQVAPKADFIIKLGNMQGCQTRIAEEKTEEIDGVAMYSVKYDAFFILPNGAPVAVEGEGKAQDLYNESWTTDQATGERTKQQKRQAHIVESTRKKARRNAIKNLNNIPTSMDKDKFLRPWIILRPVFQAGVSPETDRLMAQQQAITSNATKQLYGVVEDAAPRPQVVDVHPEAITGVEDMLERMQDAANLAMLDALGEEVAEMRLTGAERTTLVEAYKNHRKFLQEVAVKEQREQAEKQVY